MKIAVIENVDHCEPRFANYLKRFKDSNAEIEVLYSASTKSEKEILEFLSQPDITDFMFESTFTNIESSIKLMGMLYKHKDKIPFYNISVMYPFHDFETFLNIKSYEDKHFDLLLKKLLERFNIFYIEFQEYESYESRNKYFKSISYHYDLVKIIHHNDYFMYERFPFVDSKAHYRKKKYTILDEFEKKINLKKVDEIKPLLEEIELWLYDRLYMAGLRGKEFVENSQKDIKDFNKLKSILLNE